MVQHTNVGEYPYPEEGDEPAIDLHIQDLAESLQRSTIPSFATTATRDTAYSALIAAGEQGMVCFIRNIPGHMYWSGTAWISLASPRVYRVDRPYVAQPVTPGMYWEDAVGLTIPNLLNGQIIDVDIQCAIRIDGNDIQTIDIGIAVGGGTLQQTQNLPAIKKQPVGYSLAFDEWDLYTRKLSFYAAAGTTTLRFRVVCGAGPDRLVVNQSQMWATVHPIGAV